MTLSDVLTKKNGGRTPTTFDINDVWGGGGGGFIIKRQNVFQNSLETPP